MLISVLSFGSIWTRRLPIEARVQERFDPRELAYYNTTGVQVGGKIRSRPRAYGVARFNGNSGFRPECWHRMLYKVFDCEPRAPGMDTRECCSRRCCAGQRNRTRIWWP